MWEYIKREKLYDDSKRMVICDDLLRDILGMDSIKGRFFNEELIKKHMKVIPPYIGTTFSTLISIFFICKLYTNVVIFLFVCVILILVFHCKLVESDEEEAMNVKTWEIERKESAHID